MFVVDKLRVAVAVVDELLIVELGYIVMVELGVTVVTENVLDTDVYVLIELVGLVKIVVDVSEFVKVAVLTLDVLTSSYTIAGPVPVAPLLLTTACEYVDTKMYGYVIIDPPSGPAPPMYVVVNRVKFEE